MSFTPCVSSISTSRTSGRVPSMSSRPLGVSLVSDPSREPVPAASMMALVFIICSDFTHGAGCKYDSFFFSVSRVFEATKWSGFRAISRNAVPTKLAYNERICNALCYITAFCDDCTRKRVVGILGYLYGFVKVSRADYRGDWPERLAIY